MPIRKDVNRDARRRILAVERMLRTDKLIKATEIVRRLDLEYDIQCDRKSVYQDLYAIDRFTPLEIVVGKNGGFRKLDEDELFL